MSNEIDLEHSLGESSTATSHLYIPPQEEAVESVPAPSSAARTPQLLKDRLYIGNLHPTVDEYTLLQIFSKFGKISKLDFLFHKTGPSKGKPRGYAFVEFINQKDANKALDGANDKLLRGRKLVVTYAHQAPVDQNAGGAYNGKRRMADAYRPTALSILKSATGGRQDRTKDKIAQMEAKLRQMEASSSPSQSSSRMSNLSSLPAKPLFSPSPGNSEGRHVNKNTSSNSRSRTSQYPTQGLHSNTHRTSLQAPATLPFQNTTLYKGELTSQSPAPPLNKGSESIVPKQSMLGVKILKGKK